MRKKLFGKVCATAVAIACILNTSVISSFVTAEVGVKYEFEDGTYATSVVPDETSERWVDGASGDKFVFLENAGEIVSVDVTVEETGMYDIILCYCAPYGEKVQNLYVNGVDQGQIGCSSEEWTESKISTVKLEAGVNEIAIKGNWGWTNLDYLYVKNAELPDITVYDRTLCDTQATDSTKRLMSYLSDQYGEHIISGQQEIYKYGPHDFEYEFDYIRNLSNEDPAIRGFDYLNCNPLYGSEDGTNDRIIDWVNTKGGIATASWHITVPKVFANYNIGDRVDWGQSTYVPKETDFDPSKILEEGTKEREYYLLCLEGLAVELKELQDNDVPLIFRPLHEAEGGGGETQSWFWWGKAGSAVYKELWYLTYETLTEDYGLHNLIWEWNSYTYDTSYDWYPGDDYVDLVAYDKYNCTDWSTGQPVLKHNDSAISGTFYNLVEKYEGKKMVAMAENDSVPTLENLLAEKAAWLYFCPWYDGGSPDTNFLSDPMFNIAEDLKEIYQSEYCITLDELPNLKEYPIGGEVKPTEPTTTEPEPTEPTTTEPDPTEPTTTEPITTEPITPITTDTPVTTVVTTSEPDVTTTTDTSQGIVVPTGVEPTKYGDCNLDEYVTIADVVMINTLLMKNSNDTFTDVQIVNSDCVRDGFITASDSSLVMNYVAMIIDESELGKIHIE